MIVGTDLHCSVLSLGGVSLGSTNSKEDSFKLMDRYVERGGNIIDTAEVYANWLDIEPNISEKTIGQWMKERNNRDQLIVTTKGAHPNLQTMNVSRLSHQDIQADLEQSLRNLKVDSIDLYWLHRDDEKVSVGEILESLNREKKAGKIRYFGCSNWRKNRIEEAQKYAEEHGIQGFVSNQVMWSLAEVDQTKLKDSTLVTMDEELKHYHQTTNMSVFAYSSQAQGLFTKWNSGVYALEDERIPAHYGTEKNIKRYNKTVNLANELGRSVNDIMLGYLLAQSFDTFPIIGCRTLEQLEDSLQAADVELTREQVEYLES